MSTKHDQLRALARFCQEHGGQLAIVSQSAYDDLFDDPNAGEEKYGEGKLYESPFASAHGLHWQRKIIYAVRGRELVGVIIHEMGHVFADAHHPEDKKCREWSWLGWEVALARKIGAGRTWSRHNGNYVTGESGDGEWKQLPAWRRREIATDRLAHAKKIGVVDTDGNPRSVR
jgi:hypothetical protein